jgi:hypothetical protein
MMQMQDVENLTEMVTMFAMGIVYSNNLVDDSATYLLNSII